MFNHLGYKTTIMIGLSFLITSLGCNLISKNNHTQKVVNNDSEQLLPLNMHFGLKPNEVEGIEKANPAMGPFPPNFTWYEKRHPDRRMYFLGFSDTGLRRIYVTYGSSDSFLYSINILKSKIPFSVISQQRAGYESFTAIGASGNDIVILARMFESPRGKEYSIRYLPIDDSEGQSIQKEIIAANQSINKGDY